MNRGDREVAGPIRSGQFDAEAASRAYRDSLRELAQVRQALGGENPETARDVQALIQEMQGLDPRKFPGNPEMVERLRTQVLPSLEQLELQLRRQVEGRESGEAGAAASDRVPNGYADAVAEYFRKLSRGK